MLLGWRPSLLGWRPSLGYSFLTFQTLKNLSAPSPQRESPQGLLDLGTLVAGRRAMAAASGSSSRPGPGSRDQVLLCMYYENLEVRVLASFDLLFAF